MRHVKHYVVASVVAACFQAPSETAFIRMGVQRALEAPATGTAPIEGAQR